MIKSDMISASGISKSFAKQRVLVDVSFSVASGECIQLLGDNGSGKTTLLRALATLISIDEGSLFIGGHDSQTDKTYIRGKIGFLGHQPLVYSNLTVSENLKFSSSLFQVLNYSKKVPEVLGRVGLSDFKDKRAGMLSHGLMKRVSIARILLQEPEILLLDEPETGLDNQGVSVLQELVKANKSRGGSTIMTTHNPEKARSIADRILILAGGKITPNL
tara:strand:- start:3169 stop:3822 length:654 start_codon:yes stop_codon:yes gene_type:complete